MPRSNSEQAMIWAEQAVGFAERLIESLQAQDVPPECIYAELVDLIASHAYEAGRANALVSRIAGYPNVETRSNDNA